MMTDRKLVLRGLDHFPKQDLDEFWEAFKSGTPRMLGVGLSCSLACNCRCVYCYAGEKAPLPDELSLEEQKDILSQSAALGARSVLVCGDAEPLMDKNLVAIVEHANSLGMYSVVVTNGIIMGDDKTASTVHGMTGKELTKRLFELGSSLIVKLESLDEARYDHTVGLKNGYPRFMAAVENAIDAGFTELTSTDSVVVTRLCFSAVIMRHNIHELYALKEFASQRNAQFVCKVPSLVGNAVENQDLMYPVEDYETIRKLLGVFSAKRETLMVDTPRCMAWHYGPVIDIRGEVRECYTSECQNGRIGNVRESSLEELLLRKRQMYDLETRDFCPVKTRINQEFLRRGKEPVWQVDDSPGGTPEVESAGSGAAS
jgi:MoaA/NifB/PqqE/SkfB family radical SAM enzyme